LTTREKGTGLGLALCRRIAEAHGGSLALENPGERGARFRLALPAGNPLPVRAEVWQGAAP
jgi:signal transduction histidine kinase